MNSVFDPAVLFISDADWLDNTKQTQFLSNFLGQLNVLDEFNICKIWWTDELLSLLVSDPQTHPWYGSDLSNSMVHIIYDKFYKRIELVPQDDETTADIAPLLSFVVRKDANDATLKMVHALFVLGVPDFYFCIAVQNKLEAPDLYKFFCSCHPTNIEPKTISIPNEWLKYVDELTFFQQVWMNLMTNLKRH